MNLRHFENAARQSWWLVHIEAWRQSGLDRTNYCRQHGLWKCTFDRWLKYLAGKEAARKHVEYQAELRRQKKLEAQEKRRLKRVRLRFSVSTNMRHRGLQAFWAMHVEAMNWRGMGFREYAAALNLSPTSLRKWRDWLEDSEEEIDWRGHLHPSARPVVRSSAKDAASESRLTAARKGDPPPPKQPVRRFFSDEQKRAIALESDKPGVSVSAVARKHGIVTGMLFRWRVEFGVAQKKRAHLAPVANADEPASIAVLHDLLQPPDGMTAVELADGRRVFATEGSDPDAVRAHVEAQEADT